MTDFKLSSETNLPPECKIIQQMHDVKFQKVEDNIEELKNNYLKSAEAIIDIREVIVRLTVLQEQQQKVIEQERKTLAETIRNQNENISYQNDVLEKSMVSQTQLLEKILTHESEKQIASGEISSKKFIAIATALATVISTLITVLGSILAK